ncbi:hypothetical protein SeMB42_g05358 [Synchytrium endobioticum]|uniref:Uncharacterized protein n=1 Tax=Synchytrium endobioticum TaxID=286115 RepID=A0A507CRZ5_9FUNG|nr:hypothetical protein SeMB42_g05358 [Synchytrium endobioticum]
MQHLETDSVDIALHHHWHFMNLFDSHYLHPRHASIALDMVTSWAQSRNSSKSLEQVATGEARFAAMPVVKTTFVGRVI